MTLYMELSLTIGIDLLEKLTPKRFAFLFAFCVFIRRWMLGWTFDVHLS
jgi:hypothetical protein